MTDAELITKLKANIRLRDCVEELLVLTSEEYLDAVRSMNIVTAKEMVVEKMSGVARDILERWANNRAIKTAKFNQQKKLKILRKETDAIDAVINS